MMASNEPRCPASDSSLQKMVSQIRALFDRYSERGGSYREEVIADCGHTPHIEKPDEFRRVLFAFLP